MALICAFCTETTTDNSTQSISYLQSFYTEFITTKVTPQLRGVGGNINFKPVNNVPNNWSVCTNCFSGIQLLLKSKRAVDKVEYQVRKLQLKLLREMENLVKEVDIMSSNMTVVEGILRRNADDYFPSVWKEVDGKKKRKTGEEMEEERKLVEGFRDKVFNVFRDFQSFKTETNRKLLTGMTKVKDLQDNKLSTKLVNDSDDDVDNHDEVDNISDSEMDDNPVEQGGYQGDDKVKQENLDNDQDDPEDEDNRSRSPVPSSDDDEYLPNKKSKLTSVWKPYKSKKKGSPFTCDICLKPLKNGASLRAHIWSHLSPAEKEDPANEHLIPQSKYCKICKKEFRHHNHLKRHQAIHKDPEDRERVICQDCGVLVLPSSYPFHKKNHCVNSKTYSRHGVKCPICEKLQKNTRVLVKHLVKAHPNDKHYPCDTCGVRFRTKGQVHEHKKTHEEIGSYLCQGCGQNFKRNSNLKRHEKTSCPGAPK